MKLAIGAGLKADGKPDIAYIQAAEKLGYDSAWTAETWGTDALSPLAYIAGHTSRIKLATGIAHIDGRTPAMLAMTAQTIDRMAGGGRVILGIGTSGPQVVEGWHGRPWGRPNYRLRDTVAIMRKVWSGERVTHEGKEFQVPYTGPGSVGLGKPLRFGIRDARQLPIFIGAETPLNVRMTGEIADGLVTLHSVPRQIPEIQTILKEGLAKRKDGKTLKDFEIFGGVQVVITDDVQKTINKAKAGIALYTGGYGARDVNFHKDAFAKRGFQKEADRIQELFLAGRREEAVQAVPDEYVDEEYLIGSLARVKERFKPWRDSGFTTLRVGGNRPEILELMAREAQIVPA